MHTISAKLLVIDDDDEVRASLHAYLEDAGFCVLQAASGSRGLQLLEQEQPDLVICDLATPQLDGLELLRQVAERD
jgi:CheY-like chemotaxis protein